MGGDDNLLVGKEATSSREEPAVTWTACASRHDAMHVASSEHLSSFQ